MRALLLLTLFFAMACDDDGVSETASPPGCYDITLGAWDQPPEEGVLPVPGRIILKEERGTDVLETDRMLVRPYPESEPRSYRWSWWEPFEGDSIRLVWSTGFSGIQMALGRSGADYRGVARNFLDFPIDESTAPVTLDRFPCS
jgi:hypothetical protein